MKTKQIAQLYDRYCIPVYNRLGIATARGQGSWLWDAEGNKYLDLFPGWGVGALGHCHPHLVKRVQQQAKKLIHVPNPHYHEPQALLAKELNQMGFDGKCFFTNSGAEAVEAAIKLVRRVGHPNQFEMITTEGSFHGRTMGAMAATGQQKHKKWFEPITPGFVHVPFNDLEAVRKAVGPRTIAIMVEPVQGEGGVHLATKEYLAGLRTLCNKNKLVLIFDEITTGFGRTGTFYAFQQYGVVPDVVLLAKAAAGGLPLGVLMARRSISDIWEKASHATTFGGNPLVTAAGLATIEVIRKEKLLANVRKQGRYLLDKLELLRKKYPIIREVRGRGLMIGLELNRPGADMVKAAFERGVLINCTQEKILRIYPALNVKKEELDHGLEILEEIIQEAANR